MSGDKALPNTGHALYLKDVPLGSSIHAIDEPPGKGAAFGKKCRYLWYPLPVERANMQ